MAADTSRMYLLGAMDSLWFHQIILLSRNPLFLPPETAETVPLSLSETSDSSSRNSSQMSVISPQENSPAASDETSSQESDNDEDETTKHEERPSQLHLVPSKTRCHSSSPTSAKNQSRKHQYSNYYTRRLLKTRSCRSLTELELKEVKGFMELGFTFRKENCTNRLMKLLPGLQRIGADNIEAKNPQSISEFTNNIQTSEEDENIGESRPCLSEAWFPKRRDSPLLNLRKPRSATAVDIKKQLKDWARTVALIIQQED